jgi:hypothetical protein
VERGGEKMGKYVGRLWRIRPSDEVKKPELRRTGFKIVPVPRGTGVLAVDFYELVVPYGSLVARFLVSSTSKCIVIDDARGNRYYLLISNTTPDWPEDVLEFVPPERCRPLY